jgi:hypothetical protein
MAIVYITTNLINGKKYIGSDSNNDKYYYGSGVNLKQAIKKYKKLNFRKRILWEGPIEYIREMEEYWCEYFDVKNNKLFYNATNKGTGCVKGISHPSKFKPILQYDLEGNFIKEWTSYTEATEITKITSIANALIGKDPTAGGYLWKKKTKNYSKQIPAFKDKRKTGKPILQLDKEGNIISEYNSIWEAGKFLNTDSANIRNAVLNNKTAKGYFWKFK